MSDKQDWIDWGGGECPVAPIVTVECWLRLDKSAPKRMPRPAEDWWWHHDGYGYDIIKYRIIGESK